MNRNKNINNHILTTIVYLYHNRVGNIKLFAVGCELSEWDVERICENANQYSSTPTVIVNTCAVTEESDFASFLLCKKLKYLFPNDQMIICGCAIDNSKYPYHNFGKCLTNSEKQQLFTMNDFSHSCSSFMHNADENNIGFVKVQDGCSSNCSYCIVPKLRSNPFSVPYQDIHAQISSHLAFGKLEIKIIGTEIGNYFSNGMHLSDLVSRILVDFPGLKEISFNALDPSSLEVEKIIKLAKTEKRLSRMIELSVQSGSTKILADMNRHYTVQRLYELSRLVDGQVGFCWHLIVGFPTESDELFNETIKTISDLKPMNIAIHPYSKRPGTVAASLNNLVSDEVKKARCAQVADLLYSYSVKRDTEDTTKAFGVLDRTSKSSTIVDAYDFERMVDILRNLSKDNRVVFVYDHSKSQLELDLNLKLAFELFGVRDVLVKVKLTNDLLKDIISNKFNFRFFKIYYDAQIQIIPDNAVYDNLDLYKLCQRIKNKEIEYNIYQLKSDFDKINHPQSIIIDDFI